VDAMHLTPGIRFDWHDNHTLTMHLSGKPSLRFEQLTPEEHDWLRALSGPARTDSHTPHPHTEGINYLRKQLISKGFAHSQKPRESLDIEPHQMHSEALDIQSRGLDVRQTLRRRERATVLIHGINRISLEVMKRLAQSGITRFIIEPGPVPLPIEWLTDLHHDLTVAGVTELAPQEPEYLRNAITRYLTAANANAEILPDTNKPTVAFVYHPVYCSTSSQTLSLVRAHLMGSGLPHLLAHFDGRSVQVGPFVIPDLTSPDHCGVHPREAPAQPGACTAVIAQLSASVAAGQLIRFVEGYIPATAHGRIEFDIHSLIPRHAPLHEHNDCLCPVQALIDA
jgi:hypothetical protein